MTTHKQAAGWAGPAATTPLRPGGAAPAGGARPRLLDLYCKAGGASMGYHLAGFRVVGVDSHRMHVVGNFSGAAAGRAAMGISWMTRDELREAIPPAYTQFVGEQLMAALDLREVG